MRRVRFFLFPWSARSALIGVGTTLLFVASACGGDADYRAELVVAVMDEDRGMLSEEAAQCAVEWMIDEVGVDTLQEDGVTADNAADRVQEYFDPEDASLGVASCMTESDLAFLLAPRLGDDIIEDYECAIDEVGFDTAQEAWEDTIVGDRSAARADVDDAADDCLDDRLGTDGGSAGASNDDPDSGAGGPGNPALGAQDGFDPEAEEEADAAPPSTTTTTEPPPAGPVLDPAFAATPPIVGLAKAAGDANTQLNYLFHNLADGPLGPYYHLDNASDPEANVVEIDAEFHVGAPDVTSALVWIEASAISETELQIIDTATGELLDEFTPPRPEQRYGTVQWSPDGRSYVFGVDLTRVLYRIGVGTATIDIRRSGSTAFASNDQVTTFVHCNGATNPAPVASVYEDGRTEVTETVPCSHSMQGFDADGQSYILIMSNDLSLWRIDAGQEPVEVIESGVGGLRGPIAYCDETVVMQSFTRGTTDQESVLYDMRSGRFGWAPVRGVEGCPVVSPDRTKVAFQTPQDAVHILDFASGETVEAAPIGAPWSFSADSTSLLVDGGGTFIVKADGSGGVEASAQAVQFGSLSEGSFCRAGDTGRGVMATDDGIGLFDIDADSFTPLDLTAMPDDCYVTPDGRWMLAGDGVIDVENKTAMRMHHIVQSSGERVDVNNTQVRERAVDDYMWYGPQQQINARRVRSDF